MSRVVFGGRRRDNGAETAAAAVVRAELEEEDDFLTTEQCAARLHYTPPTLLKHGRAGKLPFVQLDRKCLWHWPSVVQAMLRTQRNNGGGAL